MEAQGREVVLGMLRETGAAVTDDPDAALITDLLASCGYSVTAAPLEELLAASADAAAEDPAGAPAVVTPLLPDLYVRTRRLDAHGHLDEALDQPRVAVQIIRAEDCLWCAPALATHPALSSCNPPALLSRTAMMLAVVSS